MPKKKVKIKEQKEAKAETKAKEPPKEKYFYAVGRRKTSVAIVKISPKASTGDDAFRVNGKKMKDYFPILNLQNIFTAPLKITGTVDDLGCEVKVKGGGFRGQAEAIRLGISRALVIFNPDFKKMLKDSGFLTRDSRIVERKKAGLKKARRAPQWAKR